MDTTGILLVVHSVAGVGISKERPHQIRAYGIPKLGRREEVEISASEVTKAYRADGGYLTDALYRTVFFSASGERIWERFQCDRTEPIDGNFYFSDYDGDARVGSWICRPGASESSYGSTSSLIIPPLQAFSHLRLPAKLR